MAKPLLMRILFCCAPPKWGTVSSWNFDAVIFSGGTSFSSSFLSDLFIFLRVHRPVTSSGRPMGVCVEIISRKKKKIDNNWTECPVFIEFSLSTNRTTRPQMAQSAKKSRRCNERTEDVRRRRYLWRVWISHNMHTGHLLTIRHSVPLCFSVIFHWFIIHPLRPSLPFVSSSSSSSGRRSFRFCSGRGRGSGWRGLRLTNSFLFKKKEKSIIISPLIIWIIRHVSQNFSPKKLFELCKFDVKFDSSFSALWWWPS